MPGKAVEIYIDPTAQEIIRRMARGEGWEDCVVALRKRHAVFEKNHVKRFVLRLPMRGNLR